MSRRVGVQRAAWMSLKDLLARNWNIMWMMGEEGSSMTEPSLTSFRHLHLLTFTLMQKGINHPV